MSYVLRVEAGRGGSTPTKERLVGVMTSVCRLKHVLINCPLSEPRRGRYPMLRFITIREFLNE